MSSIKYNNKMIKCRVGWV